MSVQQYERLVQFVNYLNRMTTQLAIDIGWLREDARKAREQQRIWPLKQRRISRTRFTPSTANWMPNKCWTY